MKTTLTVEKTDFPSPGAVGETIHVLLSRRDPHDRYLSPAIDEAITSLRAFRELLMLIYRAELNDRDMDREMVKNRGVVVPSPDGTCRYYSDFEDSKNEA